MVIAIVAIAPLACGGHVEKTDDGVDAGDADPLATECADAKAHVDECNLASYVVDCTYLTTQAACSWRCDAKAPCGAFTGADVDARADWYDCSAVCGCDEYRAFLIECGGDASGIDCTKAQVECPCSYSRTCEAATEWGGCVLANAAVCFSQ
jgi:hypothetical protein